MPEHRPHPPFFSVQHNIIGPASYGVKLAAAPLLTLHARMLSADELSYGHGFPKQCGHGLKTNMPIAEQHQQPSRVSGLPSSVETVEKLTRALASKR